MGRLLWSRQSDANLKSIVTYVAKDDPVAANHLLDQIVDSVEAVLTDNPMAGRAGRIEGTREWVAHKRYIVVYRVEQEQVRIITVRHTSPRWPSAM
jgi:toxin ParE1/3/4